MNARRTRFALEGLFLAGLAAGLALAKLTTLEIIGGMALGWLVVALLEWAAWRGEPHYGSGLPPRYFIPRTSLPPAQPLEQVFAGYPAQRDEAPTWIASAALREEVLGEWPLVVQRQEPASAEPEEDEEPPFEQTFEEAAPVALPPEPLPLEQQPFEQPPSERLPRDEPEHDEAPVALPVAVVVPGRPYGRARHELEPFAQPPGRGLFRRAAPDVYSVEVDARIAPTELPGRLDRA